MLTAIQTGTSPDRTIDVGGATAARPVPWPARAAGASWILEALGLGGSMPIALAHLARRGELPMTPWGFRVFAGPFERLGRRRYALLGAALMGVSALEAVAGVWLAQGRRRGALLGLALTPAATALGVGFALPLWLASIPVRTAILLRTGVACGSARPPGRTAKTRPRVHATRGVIGDVWADHVGTPPTAW